MKRIPEKGLPREVVFAALDAFGKKDLDVKAGRTFAYIYDAGEEVDQVAKQAYTRYLTENALDPTVYPSLMRMENELVAMAAHHLNGDEKVAGNFTSGGTESCMLAVKTARDFARATRGHITAPEIILPVTAHAAFHKAAHYFGLKVVMVPVNPQSYRAEAETIAKAVTPNTILIVASAPSYAHGVMDPIGEIAAIAREYDLLFHVDGCIGAFLLPYYRRLGADIPDFDFSVPGVTSISMDFHKYAYCPKGASVVLYRDKNLRQYQIFTCSEWTGYTVINPTMLSTKTGGPLAAAWAVLNFLGDDGYMEIARRTKQATDEIVAELKEIEGLYILGDPDMSLIAFSSDEFSVFHLVDEMKKRDWYVQPQLGFGGSKENVHLTVDQASLPRVEQFLVDLKEAVEAARATDATSRQRELDAFLAEIRDRGFKDEDFIRLLDYAGLEGGKLPSSMATVNKILNALPAEMRKGLLTGFMNDLYVQPA
jgi:sphinganine-1-phosphate aldolase